MATASLILDPLADLAARLTVAPVHEVLPPRAEQPPLDPDQLPDVGHMRDALAAALADLQVRWADLTEQQKRQLVAQVQAVAERGQVTDLPDLQVDSEATTTALVAAMVAIAYVASRQVVAEAADQGVHVAVQHVGPDTFRPVAEVVARLLADELRITAARAALRTGPDALPAEVAGAVRVALDALSDAGPMKQLGGTLHGSMNVGRIATLRRAPEGALYAQEMNDRNTCKPCREVNGRWLGNISDLDQTDRHPSQRTGVLALYPDGAYGGYIFCLGGVWCRGTVVGVWRPAQVREGDHHAPPVTARFDPAQPRDPDGRWSTGAVGHLWEEIEDLYGDLEDQHEFGDDGGLVSLFAGGDMVITFPAGDGRHEVFADFSPDDARELSDRLEWAAGVDLGDYTGAPVADNGLVDWDVSDSGVVVGFDPAGDVRIGYPTSDDTLDEVDLGADAAQALAENLIALADLADQGGG